MVLVNQHISRLAVQTSPPVVAAQLLQTGPQLGCSEGDAAFFQCLSTKGMPSSRIFFRLPYTLSFFESSHFFVFDIKLTLLVCLKRCHFHVGALDEIPLFKVYFCCTQVHTSKRNPVTQK